VWVEVRRIDIPWLRKRKIGNGRRWVFGCLDRQNGASEAKVRGSCYQLVGREVEVAGCWSQQVRQVLSFKIGVVRMAEWQQEREVVVIQSGQVKSRSITLYSTAQHTRMSGRLTD